MIVLFVFMGGVIFFGVCRGTKMNPTCDKNLKQFYLGIRIWDLLVGTQVPLQVFSKFSDQPQGRTYRIRLYIYIYTTWKVDG